MSVQPNFVSVTTENQILLKFWREVCWDQVGFARLSKCLRKWGRVATIPHNVNSWFPLRLYFWHKYQKKGESSLTGWDLLTPCFAFTEVCVFSVVGSDYLTAVASGDGATIRLVLALFDRRGVGRISSTSTLPKSIDAQLAITWGDDTAGEISSTDRSPAIGKEGQQEYDGFFFKGEGQPSILLLISSFEHIFLG